MKVSGVAELDSGGSLAALRHVPPFLRLVWQTHRGYSACVVTLRLARALVPFGTLWIGKLIIDAVVAAARGVAEFGVIWRYVLLEMTIVITGELLARGSALTESLLGDLFGAHLGARIMEHAATLDLEHFEDPNFYDHLERVRQHFSGLTLLSQLLALGQDAFSIAALGAGITAYNLWLGLLLVVAVLPSFFGETRFAALQYSLLYRFTPQRRLLGYLRYVAASNEAAKEVKLFGLERWLVERYRALATRFYDENKALSIRKGVAASMLSLVGIAGHYAAYAVIIVAAGSGAISVGQLTFLSGSFLRTRDLVQRLLLTASEIYEHSLYVSDLFAFFKMRPRIVSLPAAARVPRPIREGFAFENVGFQYYASGRWAVRHVTFRLRAGECAAIVGENGAGKTTLIKLAARLYDPTEGRIMLDGRDLREYDIASLRETIGVIFQDFVRYNMRFDENIGIGQIEGMRTYLERSEIPPAGNGGPSVPERMRLAVERSLATKLLRHLPAGYRQMLGRYFDDGIELSGGEWQKVALARAYMRDSQVIILDEPTAALDARSEYDCFTRLRELTRGRTAILISHRFSTVRMSDRIVVLAGGMVAETGTHEELLIRGGIYADLFAMQAARYR